MVRGDSEFKPAGYVSVGSLSGWYWDVFGWVNEAGGRLMTMCLERSEDGTLFGSTSLRVGISESVGVCPSIEDTNSYFG